MIFGYYIYLEVVFVSLCCWLWMGINVYAFLAVRFANKFLLKQLSNI